MESILIYKLPQHNGSLNIKEYITSDSGKTYTFDYACNDEEALTKKRQQNIDFITYTELIVEEPQNIESQTIGEL